MAIESKITTIVGLTISSISLWKEEKIIIQENENT